MVAHLLSLRLLLLRNSLRRSTWQLVAVIIGGLYGLGLLGLAVIGLLALSGAPVELARTVVVLAGSALVLGWIVLPLITSGVDQTIEPARLVTFPIPLRQLLVGLAVCGICGVPGVITLLASLATAGTWWRQPIVAAAAILCAVIATLTCVIGSRAVTSLSAAFSTGRRFRELASLIAFVPLVLLGPIIVSVSSGIRNAADALPGFAEALSWTPLGAIWAVPSELALGDFGAAAVKFLIALVTLFLLAALWRRSLAIALVTPAHSTSKVRARGKLGFFSLFPATPAGAVAARSLSYWTRDPRYARQLLIVPLLPILMFFYSRNGSLDILNVSAPLVALLLSLSIFTDLSYDGTAFTTQVASGIRGVDDRTGRVLALGSFAGPIVILFTVGSVWLSGRWELLPGLLGLSLGILLSGLGLSSVSSARIIVPVPAPGDNPFKSVPGAGLTTALTTFATWGILVVLALPEFVLVVINSTTGISAFGWVGLATGIILGSLFLVLGVRIGGSTLDRDSPRLLERLRTQR